MYIIGKIYLVGEKDKDRRISEENEILKPFGLEAEWKQVEGQSCGMLESISEEHKEMCFRSYTDCMDYITSNTYREFFDSWSYCPKYYDISHKKDFEIKIGW